MDRDIGKYTCMKKGGSSVDVYILCSKDILSKIKIFKVQDNSLFSNHNTLELSLLVKQQNVENNFKTFEKCENCTKFVLKNEHAEIFSRDLQSKANLIKLNNIFEAVNCATCKKQIDDALQQLTVFFKKSLTQSVIKTFV